MNMHDYAAVDHVFAKRLVLLSQQVGRHSSLDGVAIFTLSDICEFTPTTRKQSRVAVCDARGPNTPLYSTGRLEKALEGGCDVWVVLSRHAFEASDDWYRRLLPIDRILKQQESTSNLMEPWFELMLTLWSTLTKNARGDLTDLTHIEWVDDAKVFLGSFGAEFGDSFDGFGTTSGWKKA